MSAVYCDRCPLLRYTIAGRKWTAEDVLKIYNSQTQYEKDHDITAGEWTPLQVGSPDVKFYVSYRSDRSMSLLLIHRQGLTDNWVGWLVNESQAAAMKNIFPGLYKFVNEYNEKNRLRASRV